MESMDIDTLIELEVSSASLTHIKFSLLTEADIEKLSVLSVNVGTDVTNAKLGLPNEASECSTCGATDIKKCDGHIGIIKLPMDICHPYFVSELVKMLNNICPGCKSNKSEFRTKGSAVRKALKTPNNQRSCKYCCGSSENWYPKMKFKLASRNFGKMASAVIVEVNEKQPRKFQSKMTNGMLPADYWDIIKKDPSQEDVCFDSKTRYLSSSQVYYLLKDIDLEIIKKLVPTPGSIFLTCLPVTSNGNRVMETPRGVTFDERTKALKRLIDFKGQPNELGLRVRDCLTVSKLHSENSSKFDIISGMKWIKDVVLSKRTDHSVRMVVVGDPNMKFGEIGMPWEICRKLMISETLNEHNQEKLHECCKWSLLEMGEFRVRRKGDLMISFRDVNSLEIGDTVYRHLDEGDIILINRPPSIHQHSLIALSVRVLPLHSVVSLNPVCCSPIRGDFDGDCLHGYIPQSIKSTVELRELVAMNRQLVNGQNGRNLLSLCHDSLTAAYLLRNKSVFLNKFQMQQLGMLCRKQLIDPVIIKASAHQNPVWTGKQLFSMLLPSDFDYSSKGIHFSKGEIMYSSLESSWLQDTDGNIFSHLVKHYKSEALDILFSAQEVLLEWISMRGLSVSLSDLYLSPDSYSRNKMLEEVCCGLLEAEQRFHTKQLMVDPAMKSVFRRDEDTQNFDILDVGYTFHSKKVSVLDQVSLGAFKEVFRDLQSLIYHYSSNDNSLLAMVKSGSKGNLLKLIQQCVTLGLQHSSVELSFRISCKLDEGFIAHDTDQSSKNNVPYAVVESSFLGGLNPMECFMHSVSSRSTSFADSADVPGLLFKKLMFYMRDLYLAYDGTVRNSNGNQLVQFSYGVPINSSVGDDDDDDHGFSIDDRNDFELGCPVGSSAACAISEAAYSALDQPMSTLESSPLLNLKKLLESSHKKTAVKQTASLFLSKRLARWLYGLEYGAIKVKSHLERVLFSDVVSTVTINFEQRKRKDVSFSQQRTSEMHPWIGVFHVCKEGLKKRGINMESIIDALNLECESIGKKLKLNLPVLVISSRSCSIDNAQKANDGVLYITVAAEVSPVSPMPLDTFRDSVIPFILGAVIKGFPEFEKVDILCNDLSDALKSDKVCTGELYLKVHFSETYKSGICWNVLLNRCIHIMDLIDWERSHPDNVPDIYCAYGIECAWEYFITNLKTALSAIGKSILPKHLHLVADCLSVTGEFSGLSAKGIAKQRDMASVSSPFTQACFSNPVRSFIKAAKEGAEDGLLGVLDAAAWGKEVPLGTGGQFDILYSGKGHEVAKSVDVYKTLRGGLSPKGKDTEATVCTAPKDAHGKWWGEFMLTPNSLVPKEKIQSSGTRSSSVVRVNDILEMGITLQDILHHKYSINETLMEPDKSLLEIALKFHPRGTEKIGTGIQDIKVGTHEKYEKSRCFYVIRKDGSMVDFSYRKCVIGAATKWNISRELLQRLGDAPMVFQDQLL